MKNRVTAILVCSLLLGGCAGKKAVPEQAIEEPAPVAAEQTAPVVAEEPEPIEAQKVEQAADKIFFEFDSYQLSSASQKAIEGNALWLQAQPEIRIVIEGRADERGSDTYNLALGEKRAQSVRDYLVNIGVKPKRIAVISYGEEKSSQGASDEFVWAQDRRADFVIAN